MPQALVFVKCKCNRKNSASIVGITTPDAIHLVNVDGDAIVFGVVIQEEKELNLGMFTILGDDDLVLQMWEAPPIAGWQFAKVDGEKTIEAQVSERVFVEHFRGTGSDKGRYNLLMAVVDDPFDDTNLETLVDNFLKSSTGLNAWNQH